MELHLNGGEVCSGIPHGSVLGPVFLNFLTNDLVEKIEGKFIKFVEDNKLRGITNTVEDRLKIKKDLDRGILGVL